MMGTIKMARRHPHTACTAERNKSQSLKCMANYLKLKEFQFFAENFFKIRTKTGEIKPFVLNKAQLYIHSMLQNQLEETGKVRAVILKGRQQGCCFSEQMRVLTSDYRWISIKDVQVGDELVACDEDTYGVTKSGRKHSRKFRTAIVEFTQDYYKEAFEVLFDNGARLEVTSDHRILCKKRGGSDAQWRHVQDFVIGDEVRVVARPPDYGNPSYEDGWFSGIIDGEGSARLSGAKRISVHQTEGAVLTRMMKYFEDIDMPYKVVVDRRTKVGQNNKLGDKPVFRLDIHRLPYLIELFARCRPTRFTNDKWYEGHELPGKAATDGIRPWAKVVSIKPIGKMRVIDLQTSTKTFICEGLVSHNSTLIQARYFHKSITNRGIKTFILTHEAEATKNLFEMTKRYYEYLPDGLCPKANKDNAKELRFETIDSGYSIATAGNKGAGRSQTVQLMHGSEVAFWPNAEEHTLGLMQAVGTQSNTEVILESTANGIGNYFHSVWTGAGQGTNGFQAIFIPWFWQDEYTDYGRDFKPTEGDFELLEHYKDNGMTMRHIAWRRKKVYEFHNEWDIGLIRFQQEYPMTASEAFKNPVDDTFIHASHVVRARKTTVDSETQLIIGVDPAIGDNDRCAIIRRRGRKAYNIEVLKNHNTMELAGRLKTIIERERPTKVAIDCIGIGAGVTDRLLEMGFSCVEGVNVARSANDKERFANLRAELWSEMRDWLTGELPVDIPDSDELHRDLCGLGYKHRSNGQLLIESKIELRKRGFPSCDLADSLMLTFCAGMFGGQSAYQPIKPPANFGSMFT